MHVKEVRKKGNQIKIGGRKNKVSEFETKRNEILEEIKKANYDDIE